MTFGTTGIVLFAIFLLLFVFEILMFINAFRNPKLAPTERMLWLVGMLLIHPFVALVYYLMHNGDY